MNDASFCEDPRFARIVRMLGPAGLETLAGARVAVIGLGAVGSYAVEALVRAGVGTLRLVDHDKIQPTNLNRQLYALQSTIGQSKVAVASQRVADIHSRITIEPMERFIGTENVAEVLDGVDLAIDAIDSLNSKIALLAQAHEMRLPVVSCMGAALRSDPMAIRVSPLSNTVCCPLARLVRKRLRSRGCRANPVCVWSAEHLYHLPKTAIGGPEDHDGSFRGRQRNVLGSLPTLTGLFGLVAANEALRHLLGTHWPGGPHHRHHGS